MNVTVLLQNRRGTHTNTHVYTHTCKHTDRTVFHHTHTSLHKCPHSSRINHYAEKHVEWSVRLATGYGWLTSMGVVALVPLDVWSTLAKQPVAAIGTLWDIAYW